MSDHGRRVLRMLRGPANSKIFDVSDALPEPVNELYMMSEVGICGAQFRDSAGVLGARKFAVAPSVGSRRLCAEIGLYASCTGYRQTQ